jgi:hypothetical protein
MSSGRKIKELPQPSRTRGVLSKQGVSMCARIFRTVSLAALAASLVCALSEVQAQGQTNGFGSNGFGTAIHGVPPSVTSFGFGGNRGFHGVPASVTSLGFGSNSFRLNSHPFGFRHSRRGFGFGSPFLGNVVAVPYAYPVYVMEPGIDDSMEEDYRGGPTIFDRRGPGTDEYVRPRARAREEDDYRADTRSRAAEPSAAEPTAQQEVAEQPRTVLVFKDGHQREIANYAIVGPTLYDLSDGHAQKVMLAELDLSATVKQNDDRGVDFRLPGGTKTN